MQVSRSSCTTKFQLSKRSTQYADQWKATLKFSSLEQTSLRTMVSEKLNASSTRPTSQMQPLLILPQCGVTHLNWILEIVTLAISSTTSLFQQMESHSLLQTFSSSTMMIQISDRSFQRTDQWMKWTMYRSSVRVWAIQICAIWKSDSDSKFMIQHQHQRAMSL